MAHGPAVKLGKDNASGYKTRLGIWMFFLYTLIYAGFIAINTVKPTLMEATFGGLNLAMIYGRRARSPSIRGRPRPSSSSMQP
jgi:hypothetical protein